MTIKSPCKKDCPNRAAGCNITCKAWKIYALKRDREYERRIARNRKRFKHRDSI